MAGETKCMRLKDKVAIVTGGGHGIGRGYCLRLADEGAKVVVADIDMAGAEAVAKTIQSQGGEALALRTDVSDPVSTDEMAKKTAERFGRIDILVNNAAMFTVHPLSRVAFWDITLEEWNRVMAVNITGVFLCTRAVLPYMKAQGKGKIINQGATAFHQGLGNYTHYVTSRGAVVGMTRSMARDLGAFNINVNVLAPGSTLTPESSDAAAQERQKQAMVRRAIKKPSRPEDLTGTLVFLASSDSDYITGQTIAVDGGAIML